MEDKFSNTLNAITEMFEEIAEVWEKIKGLLEVTPIPINDECPWVLPMKITFKSQTMINKPLFARARSNC